MFIQNNELMVQSIIVACAVLPVLHSNFKIGLSDMYLLTRVQGWTGSHSEHVMFIVPMLSYVFLSVTTLLYEIEIYFILNIK